ncbi:MAG: patatin-like phospholipase family protein, partial [Casimicrobiaceae bacterium]
FQRGAMESFATLARAVPTGVFDNRAVDVFLSRLFAAPGRTNDFRKLPRKLFLVATNLDTGASVTFGAPGHDHVPISRAIEASSALPGVFPPVEIDGQHYVDGALNKTLHASVALDEGVTLLFCINPLVPFDASGGPRGRRLTVEKLNQGGLPLVLSQTFRAIIHSRMRAGMEKYGRQYPGADILLFEPDREDADMFFARIFSYRQRKRLCALAFAATRDKLRARAVDLAPKLARHGIALNAERLADPTRGARPPYAARRASSRIRSTTSNDSSPLGDDPHAHCVRCPHRGSRPPLGRPGGRHDGPHAYCVRCHRGSGPPLGLPGGRPRWTSMTSRAAAFSPDARRSRSSARRRSSSRRCALRRPPPRVSPPPHRPKGRFSWTRGSSAPTCAATPAAGR